MNYELAKKLKDAGFPQKHIRPDLYSDNMDAVFERNGYYKPSLEELIEACGADFSKLIRGWGSIGGDVGIYYEARSRNMNVFHLGEIGKTPTEAVANLWLKFNNG